MQEKKIKYNTSLYFLNTLADITKTNNDAEKRAEKRSSYASVKPKDIAKKIGAINNNHISL